jgi:haloacetate dehalogenase
VLVTVTNKTVMELTIMLNHFHKLTIDTNTVKINVLKGGQGFPLLLLHGYPQTGMMWHKIAPLLATQFTVIITDLRGYGDSSQPKGSADHRNHSKRLMAADQVAVMSQLGYEHFYLVGHDRGGRVAHRLSLDYPEKVKKLVLLDIAPTYTMYETTDQEFATVYYHWFFLIQPYPLPETLISSNPDFFLETCLRRWSSDFSAFSQEAFQEYQRCFRDPATIHATCEDYRASATIDLEDDYQDLDKKITCPLLVLWGKKGVIARKYDVLAIWQERAVNVRGKALNCGHFLPEESPLETYQAIHEFLTDS